MEKKSIRKHSYLIFNILFHSLCLAGLLWQVTKVSIDFFSYQVTKDINIIVPEEVKGKDKIIFIYIDNCTLNMNQYRRILATKNFDRLYNGLKAFKEDREMKRIPTEFEVVKKIFSAKERIETIPNVLFHESRRIKSSKSFFGIRNCFQVEERLFHMEKSGIGFFKIHLSGKPLPYFYEERLFWVSNLESIQGMTINYYSYFIARMQKPYQDKCFNYKTTKIQAIAKCIHNMFIGNQFYVEYDLIDENNYLYQNQTYENVSDDDTKKCNEKYNQSACDETIYFNQINIRRKDDGGVYNGTDFQISARGADTNPSFTMESKARINVIDFITYIMGALGSWIGFSFLLINPVPLIFKIEDNSITDFEETSSHSNQERISNRNKLDSNRMKSRIRSIEYKLHTIDERLGELAQDFSQQKSAQEQTVCSGSKPEERNE